MKRLKKLVQYDNISLEKHITKLGSDIYELTHDAVFKESKTMGQILNNALDYVTRNYLDINLK